MYLQNLWYVIQLLLAVNSFLLSLVAKTKTIINQYLSNDLDECAGRQIVYLTCLFCKQLIINMNANDGYAIIMPHNSVY